MKAISIVMLTEPRVYISDVMHDERAKDGRCERTIFHASTDILMLGVDGDTPVVVPVDHVDGCADIVGFGGYVGGDSCDELAGGVLGYCSGHESVCSMHPRVKP